MQLEHECATNYFPARYYEPNWGRFTTPDPLGGHPQNPQTLNKYAYAANNPVTLTDPSGLDFNLTCSPSSTNQTTCHGGVQGTTTEGKFTATLISGNANSGYHDQYGNAYSGSFSQLGIFFTEAGGATSGAQFVNTTGSDKNTLYGSGIFAGLTATFNDTCGASCVASGSIFAAPSSLKGLEEAGGLLHNPGVDDFDFFHGTFFGLGPQNFRYANPAGPSPHIVEQAKTQAAGYDEFHYDGSYPYATVPGFFDHVGSVFKSIIHLFTGPHPLPAPTTPYF